MRSSRDFWREIDLAAIYRAERSLEPDRGVQTKGHAEGYLDTMRLGKGGLGHKRFTGPELI
jgi:hypothetical protein